MHVIEGAGIAEVVRRPDLGVEPHPLAVVQAGRFLVLAQVQRDLGPRPGVEFENESLALA
jgi:hypothetical protein